MARPMGGAWAPVFQQAGVPECRSERARDLNRSTACAEAGDARIARSGHAGGRGIVCGPAHTSTPRTEPIATIGTDNSIVPIGRWKTDGLAAADRMRFRFWSALECCSEQTGPSVKHSRHEDRAETRHEPSVNTRVKFDPVNPPMPPARHATGSTAPQWSSRCAARRGWFGTRALSDPARGPRPLNHRQVMPPGAFCLP
jgi:hypothetical protein